MRPRTDTLALFSTCMQLAGDRFDTWATDHRLAKSMQQRLLENHGAEQPEEFWVLYWHRLRKQQPIAVDHLWAYLQEPCYWATLDVTRRFVTTQCSLADGFQVAIANVERILDRYDPQHGSRLKTYARKAFSNCIRDYLRQQREANISTDWGLLRRLSQTQLNQSLQRAGFVRTEPLIVVWQCFQAVCVPVPGNPVRRLNDPSQSQLRRITKRYNQLSQQRVPPLPPRELDQIQLDLKELVIAARNYLNPIITSLNQPQYDDFGEEQLDTLSTEDNNPMTQLMAAEALAEQQQQIQQIGVVLVRAIEALDTPSKTLLKLYYHQGKTQTDIANQLQIRQYQVSRNLKRLRQQLLLSVINWGQQTLHISAEPTIVANVSEVIHEWLQHHYSPD